MASYVQNTLIGDEQVVYRAKLSLWSMLPYFVVGLIFLPIFGLGILFWLIAIGRYLSTELAITNKRVVAKFGLISRRTVEMNISKVESIQVNQGLVGRLFNFGTLIVSGAGNPQAPIPGISNPMTFRRSFAEYQDRIQAA